MPIYKIFRAPEREEFQTAGRTCGSPIDLRDGFVHLSTAAQVEETAAKHFAGEEGLVLLAVDEARLVPELKWEPSRGGALFPHLYRELRAEDVLWSAPIPLEDGLHRFPPPVRRALEQAGLGALRRLDPETAHGLALKALRLGLGPSGGPVASPRLRTSFAGLELPNPIGLAAGFDKNAVALAGLADSPIGFAEIGAVTPRPQEGNPRPRLYRLSEDRAVINRFGFNNQGMEAVALRLARRPAGLVLGVNLGANKDSEDRAGDFAAVLARLGPLVDFATVNVSSPNTERLRDLQGRAALSALLDRVMEARAALPRPIAVLLKIAPDLTDAELSDIAEVATAAGLSGLVATNTTLAREGLRSPHGGETGGLSGAPLFRRSTRVLARLSTLAPLPLIGVGGVSSAEEAFEKIRAGASAVQLYTALAYGGLSLAGEIARGLDALLARHGFATIADAVGTGRDDWL